MNQLTGALRHANKTSNQANRPPENIRAEVRLADDQERERGAEQKKQLCTQRVIAAGSWLTLVVAAIYAAITAGQLGELRHQNMLQQKQMRLDQRAWVSIWHDHEQIVKVVANQPIEFDVRKLNTGKTIARKLFGLVAIEKLLPDQEPRFKHFLPDSSPTWFVPNDERISTFTSSTGVLFPGVKLQVGRYFWQQPDFSTGNKKQALATDIDAQEWAQGKYYFALYGFVTYDDMFGVHHWTSFCSHFSGDPTLLIESRACIDTYNDADVAECNAGEKCNAMPTGLLARFWSMFD
jgi:hypothetical protein